MSLCLHHCKPSHVDTFRSDRCSAKMAPWYEQQPKQWLSQTYQKYGWQIPKLVAKPIGGGRFACQLQLQPVIADRLTNGAVAAVVVEFQKLTPVAVGEGGTKKEAENACAREACRQLAVLGALSRQSKSALGVWPAWIPRPKSALAKAVATMAKDSKNKTSAPSGGIQFSLALAGASSASPQPGKTHRQYSYNITNFAGLVDLPPDHVKWLEAQWFGAQPKQWFMNAHQKQQWKKPIIRHAQQGRGGAFMSTATLPAMVGRAFGLQARAVEITGGGVTSHSHDFLFVCDFCCMTVLTYCQARPRRRMRGRSWP